MKKILILEDNQDCITLYRDILGSHYQLEITTSIGELVAHLKQVPDLIIYDLVMADLSLPDGLFLEWILQSRSTLMELVPTVIISSADDVDTLKTSFEWGAVDYLIKPFRRNELIAKVNKAQRHFQVTREMIGDAEIMDTLTMVEMKIFQVLLKNSEIPVTRQIIMPQVWKKLNVHPKTLDVHLCNLRKKLEKSEWNIEYNLDSENQGWKLTKKLQIVKVNLPHKKTR